MRIGIDARLYGLEHAGLGRYVMRLVQGLLEADKKDHFVLFVRSKYAHNFDKYKNVSVHAVNIPIYGFLEQIVLPFIYSSEKLDLLHVPHFNAPLLYQGKTVITVHDLIKHYSRGKGTTTRKPFLYHLKRLGYLTATNFNIHKADAILTPSEYVKKDILRKFHVKESKITVTYEAVDPVIKSVSLSDTERKKLLSKYHLVQPFLVYTGSVYPHKNIDILIDAIGIHNHTKEVDLMLAIICARNIFYDRLEQKLKNKNATGYVKLLGFLDDNEVSRIYSQAIALVHPSKMEGFGLTGLEAMNAGLPVISSDASCLPEIYGSAAYYFDPDNVSDLVGAIEAVIGDRGLRKDLVTKGYRQVKKYSWKKMVKETLAVYKKVRRG